MSISSRGALYVAYGEKSETEAGLSALALKEHNPGLPITLIQEDFAPFPGMDNTQRSRWAKLNMDRLSPYDETLYVDADTRAGADVMAGFAILEDGFDIALCASENQGQDALWHVGEVERDQTFIGLGYHPLQLQAGVMFVRKSKTTTAFFKRWRQEWLVYRGQDQAALLRALAACPVKMWLLGRQWNGSGRHGTVIRHLYGRCRNEH